MAIAFRAAGALADSTSGTSSSLTVPKPAGLTAGDMVVVHVVVYNLSRVDQIIAPPDFTWYQLPLQDANPTNFGPDFNFIFYHVATNSEPTWNFVINHASNWSARAVAYSGVGSISAVAVANSNNSASTTITAPTVATTSGDVLLQFIAVDHFGFVPVLTLAGALTSRYNSAASQTQIVMAMGDDFTPSNPSAAYSNSSSASVYWCVPVILLHPTGSFATAITDYGISSNSTCVRVSPGGGITSAAFTTPSGTQDNDLMVAFLRTSEGSNTTWGVPAGWTQVRADINSSGTKYELCGIFTKVASSDASVSYTWTVSGGVSNPTSITGFIGCVRGVNTTLDTTTIATSSGDVTSLTSTAITTAVDNEILLHAGLWSDDGGASSVYNTTLQRENGQAGVAIFSSLAGKAGAQPTVTIKNDTASAALIYTLALKPVTSITGINYVSNTSINSYTGASQAFTIPSSTASGDILVAHVCVGTGITITPPAAWDLIASSSVDDGVRKSACYSHTVALGDPSSVTFTFSGSTTGCGSIMAFRNASNQFLATTTTAQGTAPALASIPTNYMVLDITMSALHGGTGVLGNGISGQNISCNPTILQYTNGSIPLTGAISITPQVGPTGGKFGPHLRTATPAHGITIAMAFLAPVPPAPPTPIPPPPIGPGPNLPFVFTGRIARLPSIPPVHNWHEVNLILKQKMLEISDLQKQIIQYASNPQQHFKVTQATPTVQQTDTANQFATQGAFAPIQSSDNWTNFPSTGFATTTGPLVSGVTLVIPAATPTALSTASPNYPISTNDVIYLQVNGTFAAGMALTLLEFTVVGTPSTQVYAGFTTTCDNNENFAVTQQFTVQPAVAVANDTGVIVKLTQRTGGNVTLSVYNVSVGNIQAR